MIYAQCDPSKTVDIDLEQFVAECRRCADAYSHFWQRSAVHCLTPDYGPKVYVVDDTHQPVGAFKLRGATVAVLELMRIHQLTHPHLCAASSGSFGMSIALAANRLGLAATIFMPNNALLKKRQKIEQLGAGVEATQPTYEQAKASARCFAAEETNRLFLDGVSWEVFKGNGSLILEMIQANLLTKSKLAVIIPLGIGSLAVPTTLILQGLGYDYDLYVVEPLSHCKSLTRHAVNCQATGEPTLAEGAAVSEVPEFSRKILDQMVYGIIGLSELEIAAGIRHLWQAYQIKSEGAGTLALAAYLARPQQFQDYNQVWTFVTGNNIEENIFQNIIRQ